MELTFGNCREEIEKAIERLKIAESYLFEASEELPYLDPMSSDENGRGIDAERINAVEKRRLRVSCIAKMA